MTFHGECAKVMMPLDGVTYLYDPTLIKNDELTQTIIVSDFEKILVATQLNERTLRKSGIDKNAFATFSKQTKCNHSKGMAKYSLPNTGYAAWARARRRPAGGTLRGPPSSSW